MRASAPAIITGDPYPGNLLTSTQAGQWLLNGVAVPDEAGTTFQVPWAANPGDEITQAGAGNTLVVLSFLDYFPFQPNLALDPYLTTPLKTGGLEAGYFEGVANFPNAGDGSDAVQATSGLQPTNLPWDGENYLHLPGVAGNYASVPDAAALDITGDLDLRAHATLPDWTPSTNSVFASKDDLASNRSFSFFLLTNGDLYFEVYTAGGGLGVESTIATGIPNNTGKWVRATFSVTTRLVRFYLSDDGVTWTQLGGSANIGGAGGANSTSAPVTVGIRDVAGNPIRGAIHRVQIFASTDGTDKRLDIDFAKAPHGATEFLADSGQLVTINATGDNPAAIIGHSVARFDGVDDFLSGTFASAINGGRMFAVFRVLGTGGETSSRVFATAAVSGMDWMVSGQEAVTGNMAIYNRDVIAFQAIFAAGFSGWVLHEVRYGGGEAVASKRNGVAASGTAHTLSHTLFAIGGRAVDGANNAAIDLYALYLYPTAMTDAQALEFATWLNGRFNLY